MLKVIIGYIGIDSEDTMEQLSGIINASPCTVEEEEPDYMLVTDLDNETMEQLVEEEYMSQEDYYETAEIDSIKFYIQ